MTGSDAVFSDCGTYRYALWRMWDRRKPYVLIIGLNPPTADATEDDAATRHCIKLAKAWGYGGLCVGNLFAYLATDPKDLRTAAPVGPDNDQWLVKMAQDAGVVVAAWGNEGAHLGRSIEVVNMLPQLHCLKITKCREPVHYKYLKPDLQPIPLLFALHAAAEDRNVD